MARHHHSRGLAAHVEEKLERRARPWSWPVRVPATAAPVLHLFRTVAISPDGRHVAAIEQDDLPGDTAPPLSLVIHDLSGGAVPGDAALPGRPELPGRLAELEPRRQPPLLRHPARPGRDRRDRPGRGRPAARRAACCRSTARSTTCAPARTAGWRCWPRRTRTSGSAAPRPPAALTGEVGASTDDEQRIAVVEGGTLRLVSPADLYVYEFDWRPDGGFVGTRRAGRRRQPTGGSPASTPSAPTAAGPCCSPPARGSSWQPRWCHRMVSRVAFIGGWMSDEGSTGGDAYLLPAAPAGRAAHRPHAGLPRDRHRDRLALRRRPHRRHPGRRPASRWCGWTGPAPPLRVRRPVAVLGRLDHVAVLQPAMRRRRCRRDFATRRRSSSPAPIGAWHADHPCQRRPSHRRSRPAR